VFGSLLVRVFPDAWVFILVAFFSAIVSILSKKNTLRECGVFGLTITAVVLTLQRGMLFATLGGTCILVALVAMSRHRDLLARRAVAPATVFFLILAAVAYSAGQISPILNDWLATRYKDAGNDLGGRFYELTKVGEVFRTDPLAGLGLGARYRDALPETFGIANTGGLAVNNAGDDGTFCHNFVGFCLVKLGLPGALAFFAFGIAVLIRFFRYSFCQCDPEVRRYGLTLFTALFVCLILAQTDNVFGDLRTLPICMTAAGMMVALELIQHPECVCSPSETTTISERAAANATRSGCGKSPV
jgi:O-antigen ligase